MNNANKNMVGDKPQHFNWRVEGKVAVMSLNRPERKNPITFESYAEMRDTFRQLTYADDIKAVVIASNGGNFCSGGDVHDIIGPLLDKDMKGLLEFTRMTGDLVKAMNSCPQPIIAAVDGVCVGAGAMIALFSDMRIGTPAAKTAFLFTRVGLAGCDMGACAMLPRVIGQGRAAELLYTGRVMSAEEGERVGSSFNEAYRRSAARSRGDQAGAAARRRTDVRPHDDQDHAGAGVVDVAADGDRGRGAGAGDLHADAGLPPGLRGFRRQGQAGVRGRLMAMHCLILRSFPRKRESSSCLSGSPLSRGRAENVACAGVSGHAR